MRNLRIKWRLTLGFAGLIALTVFLGFSAYRSMNELAELTARLYRHPLAVSNAVLAANADIIAMHRYMKDVALARAGKDIDLAVKRVDDHEARVFKHFDVVRERFLGESQQVENAIEAFRQWRSIREEVIHLMREGRRDEAAEITKGKGADHVRVLNRHMEGLIEFAHGKAAEFMKGSEARRRAANEFMIYLVLGMALAAAVLAYLITRGITRPLGEITQALTDIAGGRQDVAITGTDRKDEVGEIARASDVFNDTTLELGEQNWIKTNVAAVSSAVQQADDAGAFADAVLSHVAPVLGAGHAVFHAWDEEARELKLIGGYGYRERRGLANAFALGEGLLGQCALEKKPILLTEAPSDYVRISSGLGEGTPIRLMAVPIVLNEKLLGAFEIATFVEIDERGRNFLEELTPVIAVNLDNMTRATQTRSLLERTQVQAERLSANELELKAQQEELQASNEELREKTQALESQTEELRASEETLNAQREELEASNEELRQKSEALETQRDELEVAQDEIKAKAHEVEVASRYKSEFLANMSHELRTPLNSLLILSKSLSDNDEGNLTEDQVESLSIIHDSGSDLLNLINDILDLSKVEAGKVELHPADVDFDDIVSVLTRRFAHVAEEKGLAFTVTKADNLPTRFHTDEARLMQVLNNLLANGFKFTERGSVGLTIRRLDADAPFGLDGVPPGKTVAFEARDTGIGIPDDMRNKVFHAFEQVDGTLSRRYGGTGLGLSIAREMSRLLGGAIHLDSEEGKGSVFTLLLPEALDEAAEPAPPSEPPPEPLPAPERPPSPPPVDDDRDDIAEGDRVILAIEDDPAFAKILYKMVREKGFKCVVAGDGESGLKWARKLSPFGVVLDVGLPGMDGWRVMDELKRDEGTRHIPVHFITAMDERGRGMDKGAVGYLTKPVTKEQVSSALDRLEHFAEGQPRKLLVVEDDAASRKAIHSLLDDKDVDIVEALSGEDALAKLKDGAFDCVILDLGLPGMSGQELLAAAADPDMDMPPVVVYSGAELTEEQNLELREYTDSIVIKGARSPERLLDEVTLFLHSVRANVLALGGKKVEAAPKDVLEGTVLVVDDDMRNTFALSKLLRSKGLKTLMAKDGLKALSQLDENPGVDLILMDIMMPGMDGYETMREIRKQDRFKAVPIIAVTAKAMRGDREKCLEAGADDYLSKPIDTDALLDMIRGMLSKN